MCLQGYHGDNEQSYQGNSSIGRDGGKDIPGREVKTAQRRRDTNDSGIFREWGAILDGWILYGVIGEPGGKSR